MNVSLPQEFESFVNQQVESGLYPSPSTVVRAGLRWLQERDELQEAITLGIDQADRGQVHPFTEATTARVKFRRLGSEPARPT